VPGASQAGAWRTKHRLLTTNYATKSPSRRACDRSDEKLHIVRGALESIARSVGIGRAPTEEELQELQVAFKRMRALRPKQPRRRSPASALKPVERRDRLYNGHTKSEWVKLNFQGLRKFGGYNALAIFSDVIKTGTVAETMQLVEAELRRFDLQMKLSALSNSEDTE
jgi:hypothetical protein